MRPSAGLEAGLDVAGRAAYLLVVLCMLWVFLPGLRHLLRRWLERAIWQYRVGRWADDFARRPGWQREALEVRGRAPRELAK